MNYTQYIQDRNNALLSLDRQKIERYCKKYGVQIPQNDEAFWRGVHKARCAIPALPPEERKKSADWLYAHGSSPEIFSAVEERSWG